MNYTVFHRNERIAQFATLAHAAQFVALLIGEVEIFEDATGRCVWYAH